MSRTINFHTICGMRFELGFAGSLTMREVGLAVTKYLAPKRPRYTNGVRLLSSGTLLDDPDATLEASWPIVTRHNHVMLLPRSPPDPGDDVYNIVVPPICTLRFAPMGVPHFELRLKRTATMGEVRDAVLAYLTPKRPAYANGVHLCTGHMTLDLAGTLENCWAELNRHACIGVCALRKK